VEEDLPVDERNIRTYIEYASYGTLKDIIENYYQRHRFVPEPFVWYCLEALTTACLIMYKGTLDPNEQIDHWDPIVHLDIKPDNVLLDEEDPEHFYCYPKPVLTDFGLSLECNTKMQNPEEMYGRGTRGYMATEAAGHDDLPGGREKDITERTDVYSIGATIFNLMVPEALHGPFAVRSGRSTREPLHQPTQHVLRESKYAPVDELFPERQREEYTDEIREVVARCLEFLPTDRPSMRQLYDTTKRLIVEGKAEPMKWDEADRPPKPPRHRTGRWPHKLLYAEDPYAKFKKGRFVSQVLAQEPTQEPTVMHAVWDGTVVLPMSPPQEYSVSPDEP